MSPGREDRRRKHAAHPHRPTAEASGNADAAKATRALRVAAVEAAALAVSYDTTLRLTSQQMRAGLAKDTPAQDFCLRGLTFEYHVVSFRNRSWDNLRWRHVYEMHEPWPVWSGAITVQQWMAGAGPDFKLLQARIEQYDLCLLAATVVRSSRWDEDDDPDSTDAAVDPSASFLYPVPIDGGGRLGLCVGVEFADGQVSFASDVPATFLPGALEFHLTHLSVLP